MAAARPKLPIPLSLIGDKYLLFDIDAISWLRENHNICGVFVGTLPQNPSQNVFMGLPMQLMIEEAQLLVELGLAYVLDDARAHDFALSEVDADARSSYLANIEEKVAEVTNAKAKEKEATKKQALKRVKAKATKKHLALVEAEVPDPEDVKVMEDEDESLFSTKRHGGAEPRISSITDSTETSANPAQVSSTTQIRVTPTASASFLGQLPKATLSNTLPNLPRASYALYRHLHQTRTFFHTPGLRFGSQFSVYPGDPLRFHSHFLAVGLDWEEDIDLMDIVGGGRLGTGVKKGFLLSATEPTNEHKDARLDLDDEGRMRCFSIEWAGM